MKTKNLQKKSSLDRKLPSPFRDSPKSHTILGRQASLSTCRKSQKSLDCSAAAGTAIESNHLHIFGYIYHSDTNVDFHLLFLDAVAFIAHGQTSIVAMSSSLCFRGSTVHKVV